MPNQPYAATGCNTDMAGATHRCKSVIRTDTSGAIRTFAAPSGIGATDLASAYKLTGSGTGTIAIVDAFHYPNAESDMAQYRSTYGLPACTKANGCFKVVNKDGAASPLPGNSPAGDDWSVEAALDLDMASAGCPTCKIILVEATSDQDDSLDQSQAGAKAAGANAISNSWGESEPSDSATQDSTLFNQTGVGIFVSSGDNGYTGTASDWPSTGTHVTAVGGTKLTKSSSGTRGWTEGAWTDAGSSCAKNIAKPTFQSGIATSVCAKRAASDVSAVADPNTGVAVYNAANGGWIVVGGTSASSPFVAAVMTRIGHAADGPSYWYSHASSFFDVTTGSNGSCTTALCKSSAGWDGPTGLGSPNATALAGGGTCTPACSGKDCGSDGCGGTCGTCASGETCSAGGVCEGGGCTPSCSGKTCGDDGCGGSCGTCGSGQTCSAGGTCTGGGGTCAHAICSVGAALDGSCDACAASICAADDFCCTNSWDSICVGEVASVCHQSCSGGGGGGSCAHNECNTGAKLKSGCDACVTEICSADSFCCNTKWDGQCVSEVSSVCGNSCN